MKTPFLLVCSALLLMSCSTLKTTPTLLVAPIVVNGNADDYWLSDKAEKQPIRFLTRAQRKALANKRIKIIAQFMIDSNGDVFDVKILESNVDKSFAIPVAKGLQKREFRPSPQNANRQPIITFAQMEFFL